MVIHCGFIKRKLIINTGAMAGFMKKLIGWLMVGVLLLVAVVFGSPYWTLYQLKNAYDAKDANVINAHIDFPKLRDNVKNQLTPTLTAKVQTVIQLPIMQALKIDFHGEALVQKMVNQAVDNTVTENGVATLLSGQTAVANLDNNAKLLGGLTAVAMDKVDVKDLITARNQDELTVKVKEQLSRPNPNPVAVKDSASYCGFNCFAVQTQVKGYPLTVNMQRQGLVNWKIIGVKLPL